MPYPHPNTIRQALVDAGCRVQLVPGWDNPAIGRYGTRWSPSGVVLHHTANSGAKGDAPSLPWVVNNRYTPVRACHLLIGRSGIVYLVYALGCYHAGAGGPMTVDGVAIPKDEGNRYLFGIEVESKGTSARTDAGAADVDGFTPAQVDATARAATALLRVLGKDETAVIRHRDWAPGRKTDVLQPLGFWRDLIARQLHPAQPATPVVTLADLRGVKRSESAALVNRALAAEGLLPKVLVRAYWSPAAQLAMRKYRNAKGLDPVAAFRRLGRDHGWVVV